MTRPEKWNWLHRDADGKPMLAGPNCPDCGRREVARYRCTECSQTWEIPGEFVWSWQGKSHYHRADAEVEWNRVAMEHWRSHGDDGLILPVGVED